MQRTGEDLKERGWSQFAVAVAETLGAARVDQPWACCPNCGTTDVVGLRQPDKIDRFVMTPWSLFQRLLGGTLIYCARCRIQFFDRRQRLRRIRSGRASA
jgi:hypothetical protein